MITQYSLQLIRLEDYEYVSNGLIERSSHRRCSVKIGVLRKFVKFTRKYLCQRLFFNKVVGLWPATLLKKSLWRRCFPVNFAKFLRISFFQNTSGRLLLNWGLYLRINWRVIFGKVVPCSRLRLWVVIVSILNLHLFSFHGFL